MLNFYVSPPTWAIGLESLHSASVSYPTDSETKKIPMIWKFAFTLGLMLNYKDFNYELTVIHLQISHPFPHVSKFF